MLNQHQFADTLFLTWYRCPHCGSPVTFSQYGHAHRWGWCPHCIQNTRPAQHLHLLITAKQFRRERQRLRSLHHHHTRQSAATQLAWLHRLAITRGSYGK